VQNSGETVFMRNDWGVDDVQRFGDRLDQLVEQAAGQPVADARGDDGRPWLEVPEDERRAYWAAQEQRVREESRQAKAAVLLSRLDDHYRDALPRHAKSERWLELYREGRLVNYLIHGVTGTGKTWEVAGLTRRLLLDQLVPVQLIGVPELLARLKPGQGKVGLEAELMSFAVAPVLCLDDLGAELGLLTETLRPWWDAQLYRLTDYRSAHNLPTVFTSNLNPAELAKRYDQRVYRRMFEGAGLLELTERPPEAPRAFGTKL
jgi:DNA replication protein DnaC